MKLRILSAEDVRRALPMPQAIEVMRLAFSQLSANEASVPLRTRLQTDAGLVLLMPAFLKRSREIGFKLVSIWDDNPAKGLPAVIALALVLDPETGQPLALINGETLTAIRTGAGGGLAADILARPEARVAAVFGAGVQARAQLEAVCAVRPIEEARLFSLTAAHTEAFAADAEQWAPRLIIAASPRQAVQGADIVITATTSETPVFDGDDLAPGAHVTGVGSYAPHMQEVDTTTIQRAKIVVDSLQSCLAEAGDLLIPLHKHIIQKMDIHGELGEIINGDKPGRESPEEITFFKSVGVAVQDAAAAAEILRVAQAQGLGQEVGL